MKVFGLVDANNFYASCESAFDLSLRGKPLIILSNNDGCIVARSAEAKKLGIKMGEPLFKNERFFRENGVHIRSSNYALYGDMSRRMMTIIGEMSAGQEIYSIDESFITASGISAYMPLEKFGQQIRQRVRKETLLTVGVGFSQTKTLAKLANYAAKKYQATGGVVDLTCPIRQRKLMAITDVSEVWGVGSRTEKRLRQMGIQKVLDLANTNTSMIRREFSVVLERTVRELNGESCLAMEDAPPPKQQIISSKSFGQRIVRLEDMQHALCTFASRAAEKLREQGSRCQHVTIFISTSRYANEPQYGTSASVTSQYPTSDTRDIIGFAIQALSGIWRDGYRYAKAGVMLGDFYQNGVTQFDMFNDQHARLGGEKLMAVIDDINKSGRGQLYFAGQGRDNTWQMKREMLSPRYTTCWDELLIVK